MPHHVRELVERELVELDWSHGVSRQALGGPLLDGPDGAGVIRASSADTTFHTADEVLGAIPEVDEADRLHQRISALELSLAQLAGTIPLRDDVEVGRGDETIA